MYIGRNPALWRRRIQVEALKAGADIIKIFPGDIVGQKMIKDIHGPLPQAALMPSGGVSAGGSLTAPAKKGDYDGVTEIARKFVSAVREARKKLKG